MLTAIRLRAWQICIDNLHYQINSFSCFSLSQYLSNFSFFESFLTQTTSSYNSSVFSDSHTSSAFEESKGRDRDRDYVDSIIEAGRRDGQKSKDKEKDKIALRTEATRRRSFEDGSVEDLEGSF